MASMDGLASLFGKRQEQGIGDMSEDSRNQFLTTVGEQWDSYNPETQQALTKQISSWTPDTGNQGLAANLWSGIGGAKGFADLAGGIGALGSLYTGWQQNKLAKEAHNAKMGEYNRQKARDVAFSKNINASGLGTYSAGIGA